MSNAQREALTAHRRRRRESGLVRVELQVPAADVGAVRELATLLRGEAKAAQAARAQLRTVVEKPRAATILDMFGSDLPDAYFDEVFEQRQTDKPRDIDL